MALLSNAEVDIKREPSRSSHPNQYPPPSVDTKFLPLLLITPIDIMKITGTLLFAVLAISSASAFSIGSLYMEAREPRLPLPVVEAREPRLPLPVIEAREPSLPLPVVYARLLVNPVV
ncbi:hypothetical protein DFS34DRAFT_654471 [Phlyctochytrium arcticum]|nr:hypothetical protein DFS34DRAFT_654471 [Phlyctochytrium arcticum]